MWIMSTIHKLPMLKVSCEVMRIYQHAAESDASVRYGEVWRTAHRVPLVSPGDVGLAVDTHDDVVLRVHVRELVRERGRLVHPSDVSLHTRRDTRSAAAQDDQRARENARA